MIKIAKVKCKICGEKIEKEDAYCITKVSDSGRKTNSYYCSQAEYEKNKEEKELWRLLLVAVDDILGYTCISKTKVNMIKEIEEHYSRRQLYNCLINHKEEIKRYLDEKGIYEEYGKLSYIFACIRNKIKDDSNNFSIGANEVELEDIIFETDEDIIRRINSERERKEKGNIFDILNKINKNK